MSKQIEQNPTRISFNPKAVDVEALDQIADERDMSRAELIRETLADLIDQETDADHEHGELHKPEDEELRDAFEALLSLSNHPLGPRPVTVDEAKDQLYSQSCAKSSVKRRLLKPLAELGFITVRGGRLVVHRRTAKEVAALKAEVDAEFDRLDQANRQSSQSFREHYDPAHQELLKYQRAGLNPPMECIGWVSDRMLWKDEGGVSA